MDLKRVRNDTFRVAGAMISCLVMSMFEASDADSVEGLQISCHGVTEVLLCSDHFMEGTFKNYSKVYRDVSEYFFWNHFSGIIFAGDSADPRWVVYPRIIFTRPVKHRSEVKLTCGYVHGIFFWASQILLISAMS